MPPKPVISKQLARHGHLKSCAALKFYFACAAENRKKPTTHVIYIYIIYICIVDFWIVLGIILCALVCMCSWRSTSWTKVENETRFSFRMGSRSRLFKGIVLVTGLWVPPSSLLCWSSAFLIIFPFSAFLSVSAFLLFASLFVFFALLLFASLLFCFSAFLLLFFFFSAFWFSLLPGVFVFF